MTKPLIEPKQKFSEHPLLPVKNNHVFMLSNLVDYCDPNNTPNLIYQITRVVQSKLEKI